MRKFTITATLCVMFGLLAVGQAFGEDCYKDETGNETWDGVSLEKPCKEGNSYEIYNPKQLAWFADMTTKSGAGEKKDNVILKAHLDLGGHSWLPICAGPGGKQDDVQYCSYKGIFDGNNYVIRNLYVSAEDLLTLYPDRKYAQNLGLIGTFTGTVRNVILENVQIYGYGKNFNSTNKDDIIKGPLSIGTVVGWQSNANSVVENCYVTGTMVTAGDGQAVGGIVGNCGGGKVSNCYSEVNIHSNGIAYVGGIAGYTKGYNNANVSIESCVYAGENLSAEGEGVVKVNGKEQYFVSQAGAIVGNHYNGATTFKNVYYDSEKFESGVGADMGGSVEGSTSGTTELNSDLIACTLNGGEIQQDGSCSKEGVWSAGEEGLSLNGYGTDGYKIVFNANNGSFAEGSTFVKYVKPGNVINSDGVDNPTRKDYAFVGWALSSDATGPENLGNPSKDKVVYAVWNPVYTITFSAAPGKFTGGDDEKTVKIERGKKISIGDAFGNPTRENYYFRGWAPNENPSVEDALVDEETGLDALPDASEKRTFYAVWTEVPTYIVTFHSNGHGPTVSKYLEVLENQTIEGLTEEQFGSAVGYVLDGWCHDSECKNVFNFSTTPITSDITVYAKWDKQSYPVEYVLNCDEKCSATNASFYTVDGLALNAPSAWDEGHHFMGWSEESNGTDVKTSIPAGETGAKTLYAIWNVDVFTITYNAGRHGNGEIIPIVQIEYGESHNILGANYTRTGYTQDGWSTSDGGEIVNYTFNQSVRNTSLNLYPHWSLNKATIAVKAVSAEFPYDEKDHRAECSVEGEIPEGFTISSSSSPTVKKVSDGNKVATCTLKIKDETGKDVTNDFTIVSTRGSISVKAAETPIGALTIFTDENGKRAVINGNYTGTDAVEISSDISVKSVTLDRTFNAGKIATLFVPFEIDAENVVGADVYKFKTVVWNENDRRWKFKVATATKVMPNTPYVIIPEGSQVTFDIATSVSLNTTTEGEATAANNWEFIGAYQYEKFTIDNNNPIYLFANEERDGAKLGEFVKIAEGAFINPLRAYLVYHKGAASPKSAGDNLGSSILLPDELDIEIENENGIVVQTGRLNTVTGEVRMDRWFDLKGRKLNSKPTVKGTYYKNGKRVIIK